MSGMDLIKSTKDALKHPYAWPGGYEKAIYMSDGARLCRECVLENWNQIVSETLHGGNTGWALLGIDIYWEGPTEFCAHCSKELESEYGDPDAEEKD